MTNEELIISMQLIADYYWEALEENPEDIVNLNWLTLNRLQSVFQEYAEVPQMEF